MKDCCEKCRTEAENYRLSRQFSCSVVRRRRMRSNVPATRRQVFQRLRTRVEPKCPFVNLPEKHKGRWGDGLTAEDMGKCVWVRPELVAQIEFLEWTESDHLRHSKFAGLREDKDARIVTKEQLKLIPE